MKMSRQMMMAMFPILAVGIEEPEPREVPDTPTLKAGFS